MQNQEILPIPGVQITNQCSKKCSFYIITQFFVEIGRKVTKATI